MGRFDEVNDGLNFARLILGGVFIYASLDKIAHPAEFAKAIGNYHVVPFGLENLMALALPSSIAFSNSCSPRC